jgi:vacuolar-type H+-ATPase subunit E/Vma4
MNRDGRKRLKKVVDLLSRCESIIQELYEEEEEKLMNLPEGLENSRLADSLQESMDELDELLPEFDNLKDLVKRLC